MKFSKLFSPIFALVAIMAICAFNPVESFAQKRAHDLAIDANQDVDTVHVIISETASGKYRQGRFKSINNVRQRHLMTGYKEYAKAFTQSGTTLPSGGLVINTTGSGFDWAYTAVGVYTGTWMGSGTPITVDKFEGSCGFIDSSGDNIYTLTRGSDTTIVLRTYSDAGTTLANGLLTSRIIGCKIYN